MGESAISSHANGKKHITLIKDLSRNNCLQAKLDMTPEVTPTMTPASHVGLTTVTTVHDCTRLYYPLPLLLVLPCHLPENQLFSLMIVIL